MKRQEAVTMSYRIINDVIYLGAGETPTYDVRVIDRATGAPYILPVDNQLYQDSPVGNVIISFVVRPSVYTKSTEPIMKKYIWLCADDAGENLVIPDDIECGDYLRLDTTVIYDYKDPDWDNDYGFVGDTQPRIKALYKKLASDGRGYEYRFYDASAEDDGADSKWKPYEFRITFPFQYEDTISLVPKQYKYEITLYAGPNLTISDDGDGKKSLKNFIYKEILLSPTDFIVEGTLSE